MARGDPRASGALVKAVQQAVALHHAGRPQEAEQICEKVLQVDPRQFHALHLLGDLRFGQGRYHDAVELMRRALAQDPRSATAHNTLGSALFRLERLDEALASFRRSAVLDPRSAAAYSNIGALYLEQHQLDLAIASCRKALTINPNYADAHYNLGRALTGLNRHDEAMRSLQAALAVERDHVGAHCAVAEALLRKGDFTNGWRQYEWRWRLGSMRQPAGGALWLGKEDVSDRTVLLHYEQGLGDTLQFVRYAPLVAQRGARVIVTCRAALTRIVSRIEGIAQVLDAEAPWPAFDFRCPLMSLPLAFATEVPTIPAAVPYLRAAPDAAASWKSRIGNGTDLKVGLVWAGESGQPGTAKRRMDSRRSMTLAQLAPLAGIDGIAWFSLQKGEPGSQASAPPAGMVLRDYTGELSDFADTAALVSHLDLVITVDSSVAHLAGGMGKPVWILSRFDGCWRWLLDRDDSPWYPTAKLFRQTATGDWDSVIERMRPELLRFVQSRRP